MGHSYIHVTGRIIRGGGAGSLIFMGGGVRVLCYILLEVERRGWGGLRGEGHWSI